MAPQKKPLRRRKEEVIPKPDEMPKREKPSEVPEKKPEKEPVHVPS